MRLMADYSKLMTAMKMANDSLLTFFWKGLRHSRDPRKTKLHSLLLWLVRNGAAFCLKAMII